MRRIISILHILSLHKKWSFSIKDIFSKCDQIRSFLRIWLHLLKKFILENFFFCPVCSEWLLQYFSSVSLNPLLENRSSPFFILLKTYCFSVRYSVFWRMWVLWCLKKVCWSICWLHTDYVEGKVHLIFSWVWFNFGKK